MFKKINLIIVIIISFFICNNVKALDVELKRYNDWYYKIESKKEVITEDVFPVMYYINPSSNRFIYMLSIGIFEDKNIVTSTIRDYNKYPFDKRALLDASITAFYGVDLQDWISYYAFVQKMIWEVLYPNVKVSIVDSNKQLIKNYSKYLDNINKNKMKYEVEEEDVLINSNEDVVFLKDYKNGDYLINDELYIDDNKIYVREYNEEDEYQVITTKTNNGYLYFNDDILAMELFSLPTTAYNYKIKRIANEEKLDNKLEEEQVKEEKLDNQLEEEQVKEENDTLNDVILDNNMDEVKEDNNMDEVKEDNSKIIEDTKKIVNNDNLKSKGYVNRKNNVSTNKVINKLNDKNDIIEYNNDEKGALVYSEEENKEEKKINQQGSIWIIIAIIIIIIIRKIIVTIKYRNM